MLQPSVGVDGGVSRGERLTKCAACEAGPYQLLVAQWCGPGARGEG